MAKVFMIMRKLNKGAGSTRVIMNRSKGLVNNGYDVGILTFKYDDTNKVELDLREMGRLDPKVKIINMYDYFKNKNTKKPMTKEQKRYYKQCVKLYEKGYQIQKNESKLYARYFKNGICEKVKKWKKNGILKCIDYYNSNNQIITRENFHESGYITDRIQYNPTINTKSNIQYFTADGFCYMTTWFTQKEKVHKHFLFSRDSLTVKMFRKSNHLYTYWLNCLCSEEKEKPFIINDKKECAPRVMAMDPDKAYRIYAIHRNHFERPYVLGSPMRKQEKRILKNIKQHDQVVLLTEQQKQDVIRDFNDYGNVCVIPNSIQDISDDKVKKDNRTVSIMARLAPIKQIDQAIEAFQHVVQEVPDAKLEIHGTGELEKKLEEQIQNLDLNDNVYLMGYADNTNKVYKKSLLTLLTTKSEAFALVILESMANGTPVISYDVNYGPSDIITNGEDGYLIEQNQELLANKIIELLKNPKKAHKMGRIAKENVYKKFNEKIIINKWISLFNELSKK